MPDIDQAKKPLSAESLVAMMKAGKPYIAPSEHFIFQIKKVEIQDTYKLAYEVIPVSEEIALDNKVEELLHELISSIQDLVSYWIRRGINKKGNEFVDFEVRINRVINNVDPAQQELSFSSK